MINLFSAPIPSFKFSHSFIMYTANFKKRLIRVKYDIEPITSFIEYIKHAL